MGGGKRGDGVVLAGPGFFLFDGFQHIGLGLFGEDQLLPFFPGFLPMLGLAQVHGEAPVSRMFGGGMGLRLRLFGGLGLGYGADLLAQRALDKGPGRSHAAVQIDGRQNGLQQIAVGPVVAVPLGLGAHAEDDVLMQPHALHGLGAGGLGDDFRPLLGELALIGVRQQAEQLLRHHKVQNRVPQKLQHLVVFGLFARALLDLVAVRRVREGPIDQLLVPERIMQFFFYVL